MSTPVLVNGAEYARERHITIILRSDILGKTETQLSKTLYKNENW